MSTPEAQPSAKPIQVKLVLLGEAAVGKSSLVMRFVSNDFAENKEPTIGAAFLTQKCRLEDKVIKFEIWDTAGQERFHSLAPMYYRNASAAVVVYDVTKAASLDKAKAWVKELQRQANPNIVIALAGNKVDLVTPTSPAAAAAAAAAAADDDDTSAADATDPAAADMPAPAAAGAASSVREVPRELAAAFADESGLLFFETSAKTGEAVGEIFTEIAKKIPLDTLAGAGGRAGNAGGGAANKASNAAGSLNANGQNVKLGEEAAKKEACAC